MIDLNNIPVEPTVTILNPDGSELITTNNITTFFYIRSEIKKNSLKCYKVRTDDGELWDIKSDGRIDTWRCCRITSL
jgi:CO dehydrogenase/acetyl-CoA synthase gamma subunit (corrinoid Fe-S protein)